MKKTDIKKNKIPYNKDQINSFKSLKKWNKLDDSMTILAFYDLITGDVNNKFGYHHNPYGG